MSYSHDIKMGGIGSRPRAVLKALQKSVFPNSPVPYYFIVPRMAFVHGYKTDQKVLGAPKVSGSTEYNDGPSEDLEQWVCCFDRDVFHRQKRGGDAA
jgi:hypothetical protein